MPNPRCGTCSGELVPTSEPRWGDAGRTIGVLLIVGAVIWVAQQHFQYELIKPFQLDLPGYPKHEYPILVPIFGGVMVILGTVFVSSRPAWRCLSCKSEATSSPAVATSQTALAQTQEKQGKALIAGLLAVMVVIWAFIAVPARERADESRREREMERFTRELEVETPRYGLTHFTRIQNGHTEKQVFEIVGAPGELMVDSEIAGYRGKIYQWKNKDGSSMSVQFQDGRVVLKSQFGLQ